MLRLRSSTNIKWKQIYCHCQWMYVVHILIHPNWISTQAAEHHCINIGQRISDRSIGPILQGMVIVEKSKGSKCTVIIVNCLGFEARADCRFASSQWETALLCNDVSHWRGASLESSLEACFIKPFNSKSTQHTFCAYYKQIIFVWSQQTLVHAPPIVLLKQNSWYSLGLL